MSRIALVSYRLGGTDGVSIEAEKWCVALRGLGHQVETIAGGGSPDVLIPGMGMYDEPIDLEATLATALEGFDIVIIENVISLPLNEHLRETLYRILENRVAVFHHHDFSLDRPSLKHLEPPRKHPLWTHVVINEHSQKLLNGVGVGSLLMRNLFEIHPPAGNREAARRALGIKDESLFLFPSRIIERKNPSRALRFSNQLDATLWILGEVEDFYDEEFRQVAAHQARPFLQQRSPGSIHDAYAASDVVVVSSNWEGFGNPVIESVTHRRPLAVHKYPVLQEILQFGFAFFDIHDPDTMRRFLANPNPAIFDANLAIAAEHFNIESLPKQLEALVAYALTQ